MFTVRSMNWRRLIRIMRRDTSAVVNTVTIKMSIKY